MSLFVSKTLGLAYRKLPIFVGFAFHACVKFSLPNGSGFEARGTLQMTQTTRINTMANHKTKKQTNACNEERFNPIEVALLRNDMDTSIR
jgi:hypothetical protein